MIILIHPPVAKPCEPPAGIARLSGMLESLGVGHYLLDANIEGLLHLLRMPVPSGKKRDIWTKRAVRNLEHDLDSMRSPVLYHSIDRYKRAVRDIGRVLARVSQSGASAGLANYEQTGLSPVKSRDLLHAAENPEDNLFYPYFRPRLEQLIQEKQPSLVGVSLNYLSQALCAFSMIGFIRQTFPGLKIILGGGLVTSWVKNPRWKDPFSGLADHFVAGPGEYQLLSLLGMNAKKGTTWRPDYQKFPIDRYLSPGFVLPYSASSGCYWKKCSFCPENAENNPYTPIPPKQVLSELKHISEKTGPVLIHFLDNAISPALLHSLASHETRVPWYGFARISPDLADPDFSMALKKSGCVMLKLGIESGDQRVLDALQKGISIETAAAALKNLTNSGIATYVYLMFGTPAETAESAEKTLGFTVRHSDCISFLNLALFNMPVCADSVRMVRTREFYEGDLSLYTDFIHPAGWDRKHVRLFIENTFKKHSAVSKILKNDPPVFTSNHAPFFVM
ncbi:MAG: radical SAM protein [Thermodesulfovibrionales bacterium]|nr:radical SAM protein [Thermodesulfovibrionales bacterium]